MALALQVSQQPAARKEGYTGHGANTGGLQGHSVGEMYPYTVAMIGDRWHAMDLRTGNVGPAQHTYQLAQMNVYSLRLRNMMHS